MDINTYKEYIKGITSPSALIFRLYADTKNYVKESHEKWIRIEVASLLCKDYKKEVEYDKIEAEGMRFRQEFIINYICKKYGERHRCALLNLVIATERIERETIDKSTINYIFTKYDGIEYCLSERNSMDERVELLMQEIVKDLTKEEDHG